VVSFTPLQLFPQGKANFSSVPCVVSSGGEFQPAYVVQFAL
jgi:hypothetical protein